MNINVTLQQCGDLNRASESIFFVLSGIFVDAGNFNSLRAFSLFNFVFALFMNACVLVEFRNAVNVWI